MDKLGNFLDKALARRGLKKVSKSAQICFYADEWGKGAFIPINFSAGILKVSVSSSAAAQELQMKEDELVDHLNTRLGKKLVEKVRIVNNANLKTQI